MHKFELPQDTKPVPEDRDQYTQALYEAALVRAQALKELYFDKVDVAKDVSTAQKPETLPSGNARAIWTHPWHLMPDPEFELAEGDFSIEDFVADVYQKLVKEVASNRKLNISYRDYKHSRLLYLWASKLVTQFHAYYMQSRFSGQPYTPELVLSATRDTIKYAAYPSAGRSPSLDVNDPLNPLWGKGAGAFYRYAEGTPQEALMWEITATSEETALTKKLVGPSGPRVKTDKSVMSDIARAALPEYLERHAAGLVEMFGVQRAAILDIVGLKHAPKPLEEEDRMTIVDQCMEAIGEFAYMQDSSLLQGIQASIGSSIDPIKGDFDEVFEEYCAPVIANYKLFELEDVLDRYAILVFQMTTVLGDLMNLKVTHRVESIGDIPEDERQPLIDRLRKGVEYNPILERMTPQTLPDANLMWILIKTILADIGDVANNVRRYI